MKCISPRRKVQFRTSTKSISGRCSAGGEFIWVENSNVCNCRHICVVFVRFYTSCWGIVACGSKELIGAKLLATYVSPESIHTDPIVILTASKADSLPLMQEADSLGRVYTSTPPSLTATLSIQIHVAKTLQYNTVRYSMLYIISAARGSNAVMLHGPQIPRACAKANILICPIKLRNCPVCDQ